MTTAKWRIWIRMSEVPNTHKNGAGIYTGKKMLAAE